MKKLLTPILITLCLMMIVVPVSANYSIKTNASFHWSPIKFDHLFNAETGETEISFWQLAIGGSIKPTNDLLLLLEHGFGYGTALNGTAFTPIQGLNSTFTQISLLYEFFSDEHLAIHGGIGYGFVQDNYRNLIKSGELINNLRISGNGFLIASQVDFQVINDLKIIANINVAPWYNWDARKGQSTQHSNGSRYSYQLKAEYDINQVFKANVGYNGTRSTTENLQTSEYDLPKTKSVKSGFHGGITYKF